MTKTKINTGHNTNKHTHKTIRNENYILKSNTNVTSYKHLTKHVPATHILSLFSFSLNSLADEMNNYKLSSEGNEEHSATLIIALAGFTTWRLTDWLTGSQVCWCSSARRVTGAARLTYLTCPRDPAGGREVTQRSRCGGEWTGVSEGQRVRDGGMDGLGEGFVWCSYLVYFFSLKLLLIHKWTVYYYYIYSNIVFRAEVMYSSWISCRSSALCNESLLTQKSK